MRDIINQPQADMLAVLAVGDTDRSTLIKQSGIFKHRWQYDMPDLRERNLVDSYYQHKKQAAVYAITPAGQRALADHIKHQEMLAHAPEIVPPARQNLFALPLWVPPTIYTRNSGNAHIPSRGVRC